MKFVCACTCRSGVCWTVLFGEGRGWCGDGDVVLFVVFWFFVCFVLLVVCFCLLNSSSVFDSNTRVTHKVLQSGFTTTLTASLSTPIFRRTPQPVRI